MYFNESKHTQIIKSAAAYELKGKFHIIMHDDERFPEVWNDSRFIYLDLRHHMSEPWDLFGSDLVFALIINKLLRCFAMSHSRDT